MNLRCATGSSATPEKPEDFSFKLFNHRYDINRGAEGSVNSGLDAYGPGVYAYGQPASEVFDADNVKSARVHSGKNGNGSLLGFTVDMTDSNGDSVPLANEIDASRVPISEWANVIDSMVNKIRNFCEFDASAAEKNLNHSLNKWNETGVPPSKAELDSIKKEMGTFGEKVDLNRMINVSPEEWARNVGNEIRNADPSEFIVNTSDYDMDFDPFVMAGMMTGDSENLWDSMIDIWNYCATERRGASILNYNALFLEAVKENLTEPSLLRAASVSDGLFYVIFDVDSINLEYAEVRKFDIDEPLFESTLKEIIDINKKYFFELETHQIRMKMDEVTKKNFGFTMGDDVFSLMSGVRSEESMYSKLHGMLKAEFCSPKEFEWHLDSNALKHFKPDIEKEKLDNQDHSVKFKI